MISTKKTETATFGAGCFWGVEETFRTLPGVIQTEVGYSGGTTEHPSYEQVCYANTNHAESVQITFDPMVIPYEKLLDIFWKNHNPTTLNCQGPDVGSQYRSVIFFHSPEQERAAQQSKEALEQSKKFMRPVVTQIVPAAPFYKAEDYHQQYLLKRGLDSCHR